MKTYKYDNVTTPAPLGAFREVVFYDTIQDLPMFRLNEFQIHLCQDAGIGSALEDFDTRLGSTYQHLQAAIAAKTKEEAVEGARTAIAEILNARMGIMLMLESISTKARCLADLVFSIDGVPISDFSDDALIGVHKRIMERLTDAEAQALIDDVKKKFKRELKIGFPSLFPDDEEMQFYAYLLRRANLQLSDWENDALEPSSEIDVIDTWLRQQSKPKQFDSSNPESIIEDMRRSFEQVCAGLALYNIPNAEYLTAYKFHARILFIQQNKPKPKNHDSFSENVPG